MSGEYDNYILEILGIMEEVGKPLGSGLLSQLMREKGHELSEATVGRILSNMDRERYTKKISFQGRVISEAGLRKLEQLRSRQQRLSYGNKFIETLEMRQKEDVIEILVARKAIERELARLAALNATENDLLQIEGVLREHQKYAQEKRLTEEHDIKFHKLLGLSAKNKVLAAALDLIRNDDQLELILEYIRKQVGEKLVLDHGDIFKAIKARNPERAEKAMALHVQSLIEDVNRYWEELKK